MPQNGLRKRLNISMNLQNVPPQKIPNTEMCVLRVVVYLNYLSIKSTGFYLLIFSKEVLLKVGVMAFVERSPALKDGGKGKAATQYSPDCALAGEWGTILKLTGGAARVWRVWEALPPHSLPGCNIRDCVTVLLSSPTRHNKGVKLSESLSSTSLKGGAGP